MTEREGQLYFVISEWEDEEYEHINDDPHDGWWLRPEYQDSEDEDKCQESN